LARAADGPGRLRSPGERRAAKPPHVLLAGDANLPFRTVMIESPEEFRRLRESDDPEEYRRAAHDEASVDVWLEVIRRGAQNKTAPVPVLDILVDDPDENVRGLVLRKRWWRRSRPAQ
jgi:hypothetical protein